MVSTAMKGIRLYLPCSWKGCIATSVGTCVIQQHVLEMPESALKQSMRS